jgi:hypothetical protein
MASRRARRPMPTVLPIRGQISTNIRVCVKPFTHWCRTYAARLDTRGDTAGRVPSVLRSRGIRRRLWQVLVVLMTTGVVLAIEAPGVAPSAGESAGTRRRPRCRGQAAPRHDARGTAAGDASVLASRHLSRPGRRRGGEGAARYCRGGIRSDVVVHDRPARLATARDLGACGDRGPVAARAESGGIHRHVSGDGVPPRSFEIRARASPAGGVVHPDR